MKEILKKIFDRLVRRKVVKAYGYLSPDIPNGVIEWYYKWWFWGEPKVIYKKISKVVKNGKKKN
ncbi:MAG: hypothetical protein Q8P44_07075 [Dehalococcoidia bacterium]|nr:hypothetical protein [Dehalococcoidia bacterium]